MTKLLAATLLLAACGAKAPPAATTTNSSPPPAAVPVAAEPPAPTLAPSGPKPEIGAWGFDQAGMDLTASPGDSFYRFANGTWLTKTPIPADKSNYGMFTVLSDRSDER